VPPSRLALFLSSSWGRLPMLRPKLRLSGIGQGFVPRMRLVANTIGRVSDQRIYALVGQWRKAVAAFGIEGKRRTHLCGKLRNCGVNETSSFQS
jgi:hypothetical protein